MRDKIELEENGLMLEVKRITIGGIRSLRRLVRIRLLGYSAFSDVYGVCLQLVF